MSDVDTINPNIGTDTYDLIDNYYYYLSRDEGQYGEAAEYARQFFEYYKQLYDEVYDALSKGKTTISREGKYEPYKENSEFAGQIDTYFDTLFDGKTEVEIDRLINNPNFDAGGAAYNRAGYIFEWANWNSVPSSEVLADNANTAYQETISTPLGRQLLKAQDYIDELQEELSPGITKDRAVLAGAEAILEAASDLVNSDFGQTTQGVTLKAAGDMLQTIGGAVAMIGDNPADTEIHQLGRELLELGNDTYSPEFREALSDIEDRIGNASGAKETAAAIFGSLLEHPTEFLVDYVGSEILQEVPLLIASGGAATLARGAARVAQATKEAIDKIGTNVFLGTGITLDLAEAVAGSAGGAFEEALESLQQPGVLNPETGQPYTEDEAIAAAEEIALRNGIVGGVAAAASMGLGGQALERFLAKKFPDGVPKDLTDKDATDLWLEEVGNAVNIGPGSKEVFKEYLGEIAERAGEITEVGIKEGLSEGFEELIVAADLEEQLYSRGDTTRDIEGNLVRNAVLGALAGGGTGGGIAAAGTIANVLRNTNPQVNQTMLDADIAVANGADPQLIANQTQETLQQIGLDQPSIQNELLNEVHDQGYLTESEVYQTAARLGIELLPEQLGDYAGQTDELAHMEDLINDLQQNIYGAPFEAEFDVDNDGKLDQYELKEYEEAMEAWEESNPYYDELLGEGAETGEEGPPDLIFVPEGTSIEELTGPGGPYEGWEVEESIIAESGDFIKNPNATGTQPPSIGDFDIDNDGSLSPSELIIFDAARRIFSDIYNEAADQLGQAAQTGGDEGDEGEEPPAGTDQTGTDPDQTGTDPDQTGTGTDQTGTGTDQTGTETGGSDIEIPPEIFVEGDQNDYLRVGQYNEGVENLYTQIIEEMLRLEGEGKSRDEALAEAIGVAADPETGEPTGLYAEIADLATQDQVNQVLQAIGSRVDPETGEPSGLYAVIADLPTKTDLEVLERDILQQVNELLYGPDAEEGMTLEEALRRVIGEEVGPDGEPTGIYADLAGLPTSDEVKRIVTNAIGTPTQYDEDGNVTQAGTGLFENIYSRAELDQKFQQERTAIVQEVKDLLGTEEGITVQQAIERVVGVPSDEDGNPTGLYELISELDTEIFGEEGLASVINQIKTDMLTDADLANLVTKDQLDAALGNPTTYNEDGTIATEGTGVFRTLATRQDLQNIKAETIQEIKDLLGTGELTVDQAIKQVVGVAADENGDPTGLYEEISRLATASSVQDIQSVVDDIKKDMLTDADLADLVTKEQLDAAIGVAPVYDEEGNITEEGTGIFATVATRQDLSNVEAAILKEVRANEDAGQARDTALENAIKKVASDLGITTEELSGQIGTPTQYDEEGNVVSEATGLYITLEGLATKQQVADVESAVLDKIAEYEAAGLSRDEALQKAIDDVAADLNTTKDAITTQLTEFETSLSAEIETLATKTQVSDLELSLYEKMAEYEALGLARDEATQKALADLATDLGTTEDNLLSQIDTTQDALTNKINEVESNLQTEIETVADTVTETATQTQEAIDTAARQSASRDLLELLLGAEDLYGQQVTVSQSPLANIEYFYGFESPFATPQQAGFYGSAGPYGAPLSAAKQQVAQRRGLGSIMQGPLNIGQPMGRPPGMAAGGKVDYDFLDEISQIMSFGD